MGGRGTRSYSWDKRNCRRVCGHDRATAAAAIRGGRLLLSYLAPGYYCEDIITEIRPLSPEIWHLAAFSGVFFTLFLATFASPFHHHLLNPYGFPKRFGPGVFRLVSAVCKLVFDQSLRGDWHRDARVYCCCSSCGDSCEGIPSTTHNYGGDLHLWL